MAVQTLSNTTTGSTGVWRLTDSRFSKPAPANTFRGAQGLGAVATQALIEDSARGDSLVAVTTKPVVISQPSLGTSGNIAMADAELFAVDLTLSDPIAQTALLDFGKLVTAAAGSWPETLVQRYGADRLERLRQYQSVHTRSREDFGAALYRAAHAGPPADGVSSEWAGRPGWSWVNLNTPQTPSHLDEPIADRYGWRFDAHAFCDWYIRQPGLCPLAFAQRYGNDIRSIVELLNGGDSPGQANTVVMFGNDRWRVDLSNGHLSAAADLILVTESRTDLLDATHVWFDPELGLVTHSSNLRDDRDWFDNAFDVATSIAIAYVAVQTGGAAAGAAGWSTSTAAGAALAGGVSGAVGAALGSAAQGQFNWQDVVRGVLSGAITSGVANLSLDSAGTTLAGLGLPATPSGSVDWSLRAGSMMAQSSLRGVLTAALGGQYQDGMREAALQFVAAELGRGIELHIQQSSLVSADAQTLRAMGQLAASAIRVAGNDGNPMQAFARDWLQTMLPAADGTLAQTAASGSMLSPATAAPAAPTTPVSEPEIAIGYSEREILDDHGRSTGQVQITQTYSNGIRDVTLSDAEGNVRSFAGIPSQYTQPEIDEMVEVYARESRGDLPSQTDNGYVQTADRLNGPRSANDPAMRVFTVERLVRLATEDIRGAGDPKLAEAMFVLEPRRVGSDGNVSFDSNPDKIDSALNVIAGITGITVESAKANYARLLTLLLIRESSDLRSDRSRTGFVEGSRGEDRVPPLSSLRNGLIAGTHGSMPDNGAHMATSSQLRFGALVGEVLRLHPVFAALLSPTGGLVGAGNNVIRATDIPSPSLYPAIVNHGVAHDAAGYLRVYHQIGPGYNYVPNSRSLLPDSEPLAGHINGINFYRDLARFGHPNSLPSLELVAP